jgi:hypothetical protein
MTNASGTALAVTLGERLRSVRINAQERSLRRLEDCIKANSWNAVVALRCEKEEQGPAGSHRDSSSDRSSMAALDRVQLRRRPTAAVQRHI